MNPPKVIVRQPWRLIYCTCVTVFWPLNSPKNLDDVDALTKQATDARATVPKRHPDGQFPEVIELLLASGTPFDPSNYPVGKAEIDVVIKKHIDLM